MGIAGKIGFIGGGRMAEALIKGIIQAGLITSERILVAEPLAERRQWLQEEFGLQSHAEDAPLWQNCDIVILAVKPQVVGDVLLQAREKIGTRHLIISIAAGVRLAVMEEKLTGVGCRLIRVMPNTPAIVLEGMAALSPGTGAKAEDMAAAVEIFDAVGKSVILDEAYMDAVTGLSGSGPAYVFLFIEALIDAGVKMGLNRPVASTLAVQTVLGAARLAAVSGTHPAELKAMVTSPGGTTIAGLYEMEKAGMRGVIMDTVEAAVKRSRELG